MANYFGHLLLLLLSQFVSVCLRNEMVRVFNVCLSKSELSIQAASS